MLDRLYGFMELVKLVCPAVSLWGGYCGFGKFVDQWRVKSEFPHKTDPRFLAQPASYLRRKL